MPNYISRIDFGDGIQRKVRVQSSGGGITDFAEIPTVEETEFDYDGTQKELVFTGLDTEKITVSGASATEIGTYTCTLTLKSNSYAWKDLTQEPKTIEWEIADPSHIYGVEWDGTAATTWTRTDDSAEFTDPNPAINNGTGSSPFDNIMPWSGMQIVEDNFVGTLVSIPKYWYKWTRTGSAMKLQISDSPLEGFLVSPAHANRGDGKGERDIVYVGRYHCGSSDYKSESGQLPKVNITRAKFRTSIHNLYGTVWQYDFAMYWTIMMLYLVEYANWNSQATIGYGCSSTNSRFGMGYTDNMQYHTGTTAVSRTTYGGTQYRYIEGLWDNVWDWCDGIYFSGTNIYCIKRPSMFSDTSGGTLVGTRANSTGLISAWTNPTKSGFEYALYPSTTGGSDTTYVCDECRYNSSGIVLNVGGYYNNSQGQGAFYLSGNYSTSSSNYYIGSRLMKLP